MESIKQAIDLVRAADAKAVPNAQVTLNEFPRSSAVDSHIRTEPLNEAHLERSRIVAHRATTAEGRYYDVLRTQVLQEMDKNGWQFLAITSPTSGCGKSVTACNLAMSIARMPEHSAILIDMDMHKPSVASYLGLDSRHGILDVLEGRVSLSDAVVKAAIGPTDLLVLGGTDPSTSMSEWMASQTMINLLQAIKREFHNRTVIFDTPPILEGDDVISILPRMDATLLVAGVGDSTILDIKKCRQYLEKTPVIRVVVNKVERSNML